MEGFRQEGNFFEEQLYLDCYLAISKNECYFFLDFFIFHKAENQYLGKEMKYSTN